MVKVSIDLSGAKAKLSDDRVGRGRYSVANQALADMNQFVPADEYILRQTTTIDVDGSGINYNMPYASRMFYYQMINYTTPGTGPRWDNKAKSIFMSDWINAFTKGADWN